MFRRRAGFLVLAFFMKAIKHRNVLCTDAYLVQGIIIGNIWVLVVLLLYKNCCFSPGGTLKYVADVSYACA